MPCLLAKPIVDGIEKDLEGRAQVVRLNITSEQGRDIALGYNVRGGTREVGRAAMQAVVVSSLLILVTDVIWVRISIMIFGDISNAA